MDYLAHKGKSLRARLAANAEYFRHSLSASGFTLTGAGHPIIPVMIGDAQLAQQMAQRLFELGVYATSFCYPVVPKGQARIRTQMGAAHSEADINQAIAAFNQAGQELGIID